MSSPIRKKQCSKSIGRVLVSLALVWLTSLALGQGTAFGDTLFEGYYKLLVDEEHSGYVILRYEFDKAKKQYFSTYLLVSKRPNGLLQESLKAVCTDEFAPIGYQYTSSDAGNIKVIDASFANEGGSMMMTITTMEGKKKSTQKKKLAKGIFLSTFVNYIMLKNGLKENTDYDYKAIAEEDGTEATGVAKTKQRTSFNGLPVILVENKFKGVDFNSFMSDEGQILATRSPLARIGTELTATAADATKGLVVNEKTLKLLFGSVPKGTQNILSKKMQKLKK